MLRPPVGGTLGRRYIPLATLIAGTALGGFLLGIAILAVGSLLALLPGGKRGIGLALLALSAIALLQPRVRRWIPERACQVSDALFFATSRSRAALRWGITLGLGVCTFLVTPGFYGLIGIAILQPDPASGPILCAVYGVSRGLTISTAAALNGRGRGTGRPAAVAVDGRLEGGLRIPLFLLAAIAGAVTIG